jgi:predicted RNase H-like nuclease (RuvC/YqgF family)
MDESTRASLPEPDSMSPVPESVAATEEDEEAEAPDFSHLPAEHRDTMRRLYRRVEQAAATIEQLRAENERLRRRVEELEAQPAFPEADTVLTLDDDPEAVRERISRFIDVIDTYLDETEPEPEADADDEPEDHPDS